MALEKKIYIEAKINLLEETDALKKEASSILELPKGVDKQPDLQYFSALFVSSGTNKNKAHFMSSELLAAAKSIPLKAVDIEHEEDDIIGHILEYAFIDTDNNKLEIADLEEMDKADLDAKDLHILISGVVYSARFPEVAKEISEGEWKVSMESYYQDYDLKIGSLILNKDDAKLLGYDSNNITDLLGKTVKVVKKGVDVAYGEVARVLRGILFSGVGIVKKPANAPSVIIETANKKSKTPTKIDQSLILNYDLIWERAGVNKQDTLEVKTILPSDINKKESKNTSKNQSDAGTDLSKDLHICSYNKEEYVVANTDKTKSSYNNWCTLFSHTCSSDSKDIADPKCLKNEVKEMATAYTEKVFEALTLNTAYTTKLEELESVVIKSKTCI